MPLSAIGIFRMRVAAAFGMPAPYIISIAQQDLVQQALAAPRPLPIYSSANPLGYGQHRPFQDYGPPFYGGLGSNI